MEKNPQVEEYFEKLEPDRKTALNELRALVVEAMPNARETLQYKMPVYEVDGTMVYAFASQKNYISVYMDADLVEKYRQELGKDCGKVCIRFRKLNNDLLATLRRMMGETAEKYVAVPR